MVRFHHAHSYKENSLHFAGVEEERGISLHGRYRWHGVMEGAHMSSESHSGTEKSIWEHYNEMRARLDAKQEIVWQDQANTALIFVRFLLLSLCILYV